MNAEPCALPVLPIEAHALELWNAAISHSDRQLPLPGECASFSFRLTESSPASDRPGFAIHLSEERTVFLFIDDFPFGDWIQSDLPYEDTTALPAFIRRAIDRGILDIIRGFLPVELDGRIREVAWKEPGSWRATVDPRPLTWLEVCLRGPSPNPIRLRIGIDPADLGAILNLEDPGKACAPGLLSHIRIPLQYTLGTAELDLEDVTALARGDLVVLDGKSDGTVLFVTAAHAQYVFTRTEKDWICAEVRPRHGADRCRFPGGARRIMEGDTETVQSGNSDVADSGQAPVSLSIPVVIDFEVGDLTIPAVDLASWRPGTIVALDPPAVDENVKVWIRANGQRFGSGDLVRIGDRLAVRVCKIACLPPRQSGGAESENCPG